MNTRSIIIGLALIVILAGAVVAGVQTPILEQLGLWTAPSEKKVVPQIQQAALVSATAIKRQDITPHQWIVGTIMPLRISKVGSAASGRVEEFLVNEGDWVKKGQKIAQLRIATIKAEADAAWENYLSYKAELKRLKEALPHEIRQAEAKLEKNRYMEQFLASKKARTINAGVAVSRQDLDEVISQEKQAMASLDEARATLKILTETKDSKIKHAEAKMKSAHAEWQRLNEQMQRHTVRAPFDGYVVAEHTETGEWVQQSALVATIAELHHVEIDIPVLEDYCSYLCLNDKVAVEVPALPPGKRTFEGTVVLIVPKANTLARTFPVKIRVKNVPMSADLQNKALLLKAGMLARVHLPNGPAAKNALVVPRDAINIEGDNRTIMVVDTSSKDAMTGKARPVDVQLGVANADYVEVLPVKDELKEGQIVVTEGNERLRPGQPVAIKEKR